MQKFYLLKNNLLIIKLNHLNDEYRFKNQEIFIYKHNQPV
jgi:hypothetical protein